MTTVAIIGAGLSGLVAARCLADAGLSVVIFEKSRGTGGRMATRRADGEISFDHGAQYFTVRNPEFRERVEAWIKTGIVAAWPNTAAGQRVVVLKDGKLESESGSVDRFVGVPAMNSVCKHLATGLDIRKQVRVARVVQVDGTVRLIDDLRQTLGRQHAVQPGEVDLG